MAGIMGWMGFMSLMEVGRIWELRKAQRLYTHPLFTIARSWQRREHDGSGFVTRLNMSDYDDEPLTRKRSWSCAGCLSSLFPCFLGARSARTAEMRQPFLTTGDDASEVGAPAAQLDIGLATSAVDPE